MAAVNKVAQHNLARGGTAEFYIKSNGKPLGGFKLERKLIRLKF